MDKNNPRIINENKLNQQSSVDKNVEIYRTVFTNSKESILIVEQDTFNILWVNHKACITYGYTYEELLGMNIEELSGNLEQSSKSTLDSNIEYGDIPIHFHKEKDGTIFPVHMQTSPLTINSQKILVYEVNCVSNIKQDDEVLKQHMKDLLETQRIAQIGTWRLNVLTNEVVWSKELYNMYGFDSSLPVPSYTDHKKLFTPDSWSRLSKAVELTITAGVPYEIELGIVKKDGTNRYVWARGETEKDSNGNIVAIWGVAQDITERKLKEDKLKISENRFREVIKNLNAGIVIHAPDGSIIDCNERALKLLGLNLNQIIGKFIFDPNWKFIKSDGTPLKFEEFPIHQILSTKLPLENRLIGVINIRESTTNWNMVNGAPILNDQGDIVEIVISFIDFTDLINAEIQLQSSEEQYRLLTTQMQLGLALHEIICDESGIPIDYRFLSINHAFEQLIGLKNEEIIGRKVLDVFPRTEHSWIKKYGEVALTGIATQFDDFSIELQRYYSVSAYSPKKGQFAVIVQDITDRKVTEHLLYKEKELFKTTLFSVGDGVISTDTNGNVIIMNKVSEQLTGWTLEEAIGKPIESIFHITNEFNKQVKLNPVSRVLDTKEVIELDNNTILISKDGDEIPIEDSASPIIDEHGNIAGVVLVFRDFTGKKKNLDEIKYLSFHDYLTGLYNRRYYETEVKRLDTQRNWPLTIVLGDVNGLKLINDSFGHDVGDQLLRKVSDAIRNGCRSDDIVSRMGGDEFAILLPKTDSVEAAQLIKRISNLLKNETIEGIEISVSFGYATKNSKGEDTETIFKKAEDAMYHNKLYEGPSIKGKVIDNIVESLNNKSQREEIHSRHVSELCGRMGEALGLDEFQIKELKALGLLHDIGKIAISDKILNKADRLTNDEWIEMKSHAETGYRILNTNIDMNEIAEYVLAHHERWDGSGYPKGLKGKAIPLPARICSIADAYDAMISIRSYKPSLQKEVVLDELRNNAGTQFDPDLVKLFIEIVIA